MHAGRGVQTLNGYAILLRGQGLAGISQTHGFGNYVEVRHRRRGKDGICRFEGGVRRQGGTTSEIITVYMRVYEGIACWCSDEPT